MEVRLGQLKKKIGLDERGMMQGWFDRRATLGLRTGFLQRNLGLD